MIDDQALVDKALAGDDVAFGDLVDRHRGAVFRAGLAVLGSPALMRSQLANCTACCGKSTSGKSRAPSNKPNNANASAPSTTRS